MTSTCLDLNGPVEIECETQYLVGDIELFLKPENSTSHLHNCSTESYKNKINSFCRNLNKTDKCKFSVSNSGYEDCYVSSKNISVSFQCSSKFPCIFVYKLCNNVYVLASNCMYMNTSRL